MNEHIAQVGMLDVTPIVILGWMALAWFLVKAYRG